MTEMRSASQAIHDFLTWAQIKGLALAEFRETYGGEWVRSNVSLEKLLAEHFGIDLDKVEAEKRAMLADLQRAS